MEMIDMSGQPRSDEDIQDALKAVNTILIKHPTDLPLFTVHAGIIRDSLIECLKWRKLVCEARSKIT